MALIPGQARLHRNNRQRSHHALPANARPGLASRHGFRLICRRHGLGGGTRDLTGVRSESEKVALKAQEGKEPTLKAAAGEMRCAKLNSFALSSTGLHINLFNEVLLDFLECIIRKGESQISAARKI
jgi:hypothetical protein